MRLLLLVLVQVQVVVCRYVLLPVSHLGTKNSLVKSDKTHLNSLVTVPQNKVLMPFSPNRLHFYVSRQQIILQLNAQRCDVMPSAHSKRALQLMQVECLMFERPHICW